MIVGGPQKVFAKVARGMIGMSCFHLNALHGLPANPATKTETQSLNDTVNGRKDEIERVADNRRQNLEEFADGSKKFEDLGEYFPHLLNEQQLYFGPELKCIIKHLANHGRVA